MVSAAIDSALSQQVDELSVVVVDNHSDDGTWDVINSIRDPRLRVHRNSANLGLFGNFNRSAEYASETYTLFLCSDDRLVPGFLASAIALMKSNRDAALLSSRGRIVDVSGNFIEVIADRLAPGRYIGQSVPAAWFWASYFLGENLFNYPSGILFRTADLKRCLPFDESLGSPADIDMFLRVLRLGDLLISEDVGCLVTRHDGQEQNAFRRNADLVRQELLLLERYRPMLESVNAYADLRRQSATLVLSAIFRTCRFNIKRAQSLFREFGRRPWELIAAAIRRTGTRISDNRSSSVPYIVKRPVKL